MILPYRQVAEKVFDPNSEPYRSQADLVFLLLDHRGWPLKEGAGNAIAYMAERQSARNLLQSWKAEPVPIQK